jgi:hypothetical protein
MQSALQCLRVKEPGRLGMEGRRQVWEALPSIIGYTNLFTIDAIADIGLIEKLGFLEAVQTGRWYVARTASPERFPTTLKSGRWYTAVSDRSIVSTAPPPLFHGYIVSSLY